MHDSPCDLPRDLSAGICYFLAGTIAEADIEQKSAAVSGFMLGHLNCLQHAFWELQGDKGEEGFANTSDFGIAIGYHIATLASPLN